MSDGGAYSVFRPILLVLTHDFIITCVYGLTDMNGTTRTLRCAPFLCRLRQRECCMLGAPSSQPTVPLHELPPARLMIHQQTSAHKRRKWTRSVQSRSGILAYLSGFGNIPNFVPTLFSYLCDLIPSQTGIATLWYDIWAHPQKFNFPHYFQGLTQNDLPPKTVTFT